MKLKILGAITSACIFILYFGFVLTLIVYTSITEGGMPIFGFILLLVLFAIPFIAMIVTLWMRIKEILSGEEEEAKKY